MIFRYAARDPFPSSGSASKITTTTYDTYGRQKVQTLPNLVTVTTTYSDDALRTVTSTNSTGEIYTKQYDAAGLLTTATDPGGSVSYTYFSTGKPKNIQPSSGAGISTIIYSPETGMQTSLADPNTGTNTYDYNTFGELTSQTDGNSKNTVIVYDKLGRVYTKTLNGVVTTYYYDPAGAIGAVDRITETDGSGMAYTYDALTRVKSETRSKNTDAFTYKYEYDGKSRVNKLTYPGNMVLTYGYNSTSGDLMSISKDGTALWSLGTTVTDVNDFGQILKVTMGNGKTTNYGYDTQNRLNSISASNIINFSYQFNDKQQLNYRDERMYNGTSMAGFKKSFTYDGVNRLWTATKDNGNTPLTMVYKTGVNDRIDNKSDVGGYVYNETTNHCIDKLNTVAGYNPPQHNLTYNDEGKTSIITETNNGAVNKTLTLDYGLDGERFSTEYTQDGNKITRYYFDAYEKEIKGTVTKQLNYIYAGNQLIAIFEQNSVGGDKMHYVYTDYLGSLRCITSNNGTIEQCLSYDAWGNRCNYQDGTKLTDAQITAATLLTSRGYIGQEHMDGLGLINMNARFYDPALGIFISPDNFVADPDFSQAFNRFAYGLNNPMSYVDPDGNNPVLIAAIIIGALAGGYTGYKVADAKGYNMGDWQTYGFILGGAAIGGFSGYAGATIAAGGGFMANTMGIMYSSMSYSMGMSALSGGMIQPSVSFGFGSYNFGTGEFNYLFDGDNKWYEDLGYTFGALANVQDIFAGFNGTDIKVASHNSFNLKTPHSYINGKDIDISVANRIPTNSKNMFQYAWRILTKSKYRTAGYYDVADKSKDWVVELNNVRSTTLQKITANIKNVNSSGLPDPKGLFGWGHLKFGIGFGCVQHASRSLLASGVWYVPFNPLPQLLNAQLLIRQMGIYASPYLVNQ